MANDLLDNTDALTGRMDVRLPLLTTKGVGPELVDAMVAALAGYGIEMRRAQPPWPMTAPASVLRKLGGRAFSSFVGEETPQVHNLRLATALAPWRVADWPFAGRIVVRERHPDGRFEEAHVFDRWCHVGTARSEDELEDLATTRIEIDFDPDIYRILHSYIAKHRASVRAIPAGAHEARERDYPDYETELTASV